MAVAHEPWKAAKSLVELGIDFVDPRVFGLTKAAYNVHETLNLLSIGRTSLYAAIKAGDLRPVKFGRKTLFYARDLATFSSCCRSGGHDRPRIAGGQCDRPQYGSPKDQPLHPIGNTLRGAANPDAASPAFRVLSLSGRRVLDRIEIEFAGHGGTTNGRLPIPYDDFERYGIHRHAIAPAIRECIALGLTEVTEAGRAGNAECRRPNLFRLTYRATDNGPATNEWQRIKTVVLAREIARAARKPQKKKSND